MKTTMRYLPIKTERKNKCIGTLSIGDDMFRNQFGVIGNRRRNNKKKNRLSIFSSIWKITSRYKKQFSLYFIASAFKLKKLTVHLRDNQPIWRYKIQYGSYITNKKAAWLLVQRYIIVWRLMGQYDSNESYWSQWQFSWNLRWLASFELTLIFFRNNFLSLQITFY